MKLFDTHAHYDDARFESEYEGGTDAVLRDCFNDCIGNIVNIGTSLENSRRSIELAEKYDQIYASVGIHPSECLKYENVDLVICELEKMLRHEKVVALGEIGLDYHWDDVPRDIQAIYFEKQMELAQKLGVPVIIHDREAHGDCLEMIKNFHFIFYACRKKLLFNRFLLDFFFTKVFRNIIYGAKKRIL